MNTEPYYNKELNTLFLNRVKNHKYIINKKPELKNINCNVFMTAISRKDKDNIENIKSLSLEDKEKAIKNLYPIDLKSIIMFGNGNKDKSSFTNAEGLIYRYDRKDRTKENNAFRATTPFYRNYEMNEEAWQEASVLVNMCPDIKMSWQSAIRKLGGKDVHGLTNAFKPFYVVIWYEVETKKE